MCIRLYSREDYETRALYTAPEILRSNLAEVILRMLSLRIEDPAAFPFVDPPAPKNIRGGYDVLEELGAIERENGEGGEGRYRLTARGRRMARLPLDPRISRMILEAEKEGCLGEILVIAAALSTQDPRERPAGKEKEADGAQALFVNASSDFLTLITIWQRFHDSGPNARSPGRLRKFCRDHFLSFRRMKEWRDVHGQLREIVEEEAPPPGGRDPEKKPDGDPQAWYGRIHRSVLSGYLSNIAVKKEKNTYGATGGRQVVVFPGSGLYNRGGDWIVAAEFVETTQLFARTAANIDREWLEALGGSLCRSVYLNARWDRKRGEVTALERVSLYGLLIVEGRRISFGRVDPQEATRIFMQSKKSDRMLGNMVFMGVDDLYLRLKAYISIQRGKWFSGDHAPEAILGYNAAATMGLDLGQKIDVGTAHAPLTIVGVAEDLMVQAPAFGGNAAFYVSRDMAENVFGAYGYTHLRVQVPVYDHWYRERSAEWMRRSGSAR